MPIATQVAKVLAEKGNIAVATNDHDAVRVMKNKWLIENIVVEPLITPKVIFDKPRSKYHK